jgi:type I restriction enzyme, S subunit
MSPVERSVALSFCVKRGEIKGRIDVNYWRLTPLFQERFKNPNFPVVKLGHLVELIQYGCSKLATAEQIGYPMLRMNNLQNDGWDLSDLKYIVMNEKELETYHLQKNDLLFNRTNSKELVGKCEIFREDGDWVFASYLIRVRLNTSKANPQFISDFLSTAAGRLQINRLSRQIIGMTNINAEELRDISIPIPSLDIQHELVTVMNTARASRQEKLVEADTLLAGLDGFILDTLGLMPPPRDDRRVFALRVRDLGKRIDAYSNQLCFRKLFTYIHQSSYPIASFKEITTRIFSGITPLAKGDSYVRPPAGVRFIRSGEITADGEVTETSEVHISASIHNGLMKNSQLESGDLLIAIVGATIGAAGVFRHDSPANINQAIATVRLASDEVSPEYACLYLRSSIGQALLDYFKRPVARANINLEEIGEFPILIPPKSIQDTIVIESRRRREEARRLRTEAEDDWNAAKHWFEEQLLGGI